MVSLTTISASYDYRLVGLSIAIAILASYVALDLAGRVSAAQGRTRFAWLMGGALAMGTGIWSMHYTGMLAYRLPIDIYYHIPTVVLSLLSAVFASWVALFLVTRRPVTPWHIAAGSLLMGTGIVSMHYLGMTAMRMRAMQHYHAGLVAFSAVLGIAVSGVALWLTNPSDRRQESGHFKLISTLIMGLAIPSVHYTGMAAVTVTPSNITHDLSNATHISVMGDIAIVLVTIIVLGAAMLTSAVDRWLSRQTQEMLWLREEAEEALAQKERMFRDLVEGSPDAILVHDGKRILFANPACMKLLRAETQAQLVGRNLLEILHPDYRAAIGKLIEERYQTGIASPPGEHVLIALDGSLVPVEAVGIPFLWDGLPAHEVVLRDISRRKQVERALQEWQKRHELAQKAGLQLGGWEWDLETGTVIWSDEVYRQFGYTRENFGGKIGDFFARLHPEDRPRVEQVARKIVEGNPEYAAQFRVVRPDATTCWIDCRGVVIRDGPARMIGITIDITDLKKNQQSLQDSQEQYLALLNSTAEAIYGVDLQGNCTFCNPACLRFLGYQSPEDLLGKNMHALMHHSRPDGSRYPEQECRIYAAARDGQPSHSDEVLWRADGTSFLAEYWSFPLFKGGMLMGSVVTFLDISDRKRAEEAQSRSEQLFRLIAENSADLIAVVDKSGKRIYNNPAYRNILGYSPEELKKTIAFEQIHPDDRGMVKHTAEEALRTGVGKMIEFRMQRKDGTYVSLESHGSFIRNARGEIEAQVISARDIGPRKVAAQAEKLGAIGQLAAGIAHEINTTVQYLSDNVSFLHDAWTQVDAAMAARADAAAAGSVASASQTQTGSAPSEDWAFLQKEVPSAIAQSLEGIRRISKIVGAMRKFSHSGGGEKELVDINDALDTTLTVAHNELKHIADVETDFQTNLPRVECLPDEMNQVFLNLIVNAAHAMRDLAHKNPPQRGKVVVRTGLIEDAVQIEIQDNGTGIPENARSRVFDPFFTTKQVGEGTGQGLAISHDVVVNKHGGKIWFDTELGKGTTFSVRLPLKFGKDGGGQK